MTLESKTKWVLPPKYKAQNPASVTSSKSKISSAVLSILSNRGLKTEKHISDFFNATIDDLPTPDKLYNSKKAAQELITAVKENKRIFVYGDFDADGISATSLLWDFLYRVLWPKFNDAKTQKPAILPYIPDRGSQGYGLSESTLDEITRNGADLVITVDCGIRDEELIESYSKKHKLEFIVTDHHQPPDDFDFKTDYTIVHPMFAKYEYPQQEICGTAVVFFLIQQILAELNEFAGYTEDAFGLDLVALTTVTDVMPLLQINRILVKAGLEQLRKGNRLGIKKLAEVAGINQAQISAYDLGYILGPRINAAGRIGSALDALRLLVSQSDQKTEEYAQILNSLNSDRQEITDTLMIQAREIAQTQLTQRHLLIVGKEWPEGIIGILAGKLMEEFGLPTLVVTENENDIRGSARSFGNVNITHLIESVADDLEKYGGHAQASGFAIKQGKLESFVANFNKSATDNIQQEDLQLQTEIDLVISTSDITMPFYMDLQKLEPFGEKNKRPLLMIKEAVIVDLIVMGRENNHARLKLKGDGIDFVEAIMFNCSDDFEKLEAGEIIDLVGYLDVNSWNGNTSLQFKVNQWRFSPET